MSRKTPQTEELTRYLLGELPEEERASLEDAFLGDAGLFTEVEEAERDLLDDYVGGRMGARERERFERHYLRLPGSRERLRAAQLIARERAGAAAAGVAPTPAEVETGRAGIFGALRAFWRGALPSMTPYALGLAVLALIVGGVWWAVTRSARDEAGRAPELAKAIPEATPFPDWKGTRTAANTPPDTNANVSAPTQNVNGPAGRDETQTRAPREPRPAPSQTPARPRSVTVLALAAGLTRGEGEANKLVVPKNADAVRLEFDLGGGVYANVRASLRTVEGREVWAGAVARPRAGRRAAVTLPARLFADEDYLLILTGTNASGGRVELQEFYFNAAVR